MTSQRAAFQRRCESRGGADKSLPFTFQETVNKVSPVGRLKFASPVERTWPVNGLSYWHAALRNGLLRFPLERAPESRSLEESFPVVVPVASSFGAFALSEQSARSLRLSGDNNQPSFSAIRPSERFGWACLYSTLITLVQFRQLHCCEVLCQITWITRRRSVAPSCLLVSTKRIVLEASATHLNTNSSALRFAVQKRGWRRSMAISSKHEVQAP